MTLVLFRRRALGEQCGAEQRWGARVRKSRQKEAAGAADAVLMQIEWSEAEGLKSAILAWKYDQDLSYSFSHLKFRPVPSLLFAISSGDKNPANPDLQTFYPLFPKGLYYGFIDDSGF
jgi:hypothetical protein